MLAHTKNRVYSAESSNFLRELGERHTQFGYDATEDKKRRRLVSSVSRSEDRELDTARRKQLQASARDLPRNFAIAAWAIRKHLDFVSRFNFDCSTGDTNFDDTLESLMAEFSEAENFDIQGRHDRDRWLRIFEARACVDGDVLGVMLKSGHLQAIESDRIKSRYGWDADDSVVHGVRLDAAGRARSYQIHRRLPFGSMEYEREVAAENCLFHGYFDRFDQVRGISPLAPGLNSLQDVYENFDYALAKAKVSQLFGIAFTRDADEAPAPVTEDVDDEDSDEGPRYSINFGRGPVTLDLEPGDKAEILESKQPSHEFREFTLAMIMVALKSLDIPFCFYDESHTNYYGSRAAVVLYIAACDHKRKQLHRMLRQMTIWKVRQWVTQGRLVLPAGMKPETIPCTWTHAGIPWWDPSKEVNADLQAVKAGLRSRREIRKERFGDDWFKVAEDLREEELYAEQLGLVMESQVLQPVVDPAANESGGTSGRAA